MNLEQIFDFTKSDKSFIKILQDYGLIKEVARRTFCRRVMKMEKRKQAVLGHVFCCENKNCRRKTILSGSILENMKNLIRSFFLMAYFFFYEVNIDKFLRLQTDISSSETCTYYKKLFRNVILEIYVF